MQLVSHIEGYRKSWGASPARPLTPREREILKLVAQGKGNQEIGDCLGISLRTVKVHLANTFEKLGVNRRLEAAAFLLSDSNRLTAVAS